MKKHQITISSPEPMNVQQTKQGFTVTYGNTPPEQISISMQSEGGEEPKPSFKNWRAEKGELYYIVFTFKSMVKIECCQERNDRQDEYNYITGNYFQTKQEAEAYKARQEAIGRVTHAIIEANEGWEPDWGDNDQFKYSIVYNREKNILVDHWDTTWQTPTIIPTMPTRTIALSIISSHKEDLDLIFNLKK